MPLSDFEAFVVRNCGLHRRKIKLFALWFADVIFFAVTLPLSLYVRLDFSPPYDYVSLLFNHYLLVGMFCYTVFSALMKTYSTIIRLANLNTALRIAIASLLGSATFYLATNYLLNFQPIPRSVFLIQMLLFVPLATLCRFSFRLLERFSKLFEEGVPTLIYGAGRTTNIFLPAMLKPASGIKVVGIVDDDRNKRRGEVQGILVLGNGDDLPALVHKHQIQQVVICMPNLDGTILRRLVARLRDLSVVVKIAPEANDYLKANRIPENVGLRDLKIEDLLRRTPRKVDHDQISSMILNQSVLVTGGGGSIGSELCRQIAAMDPKALIINDASEFNLYTIVEELKVSFSNCRIVAILGDLSHNGFCDEIFDDHKVDLIFHAAAYKHVPLVEENINVALRNNICGTYNLFKAAWAADVKRVVLVSSDKAVNPTNVMGATKRACELIGLWFGQSSSATTFSAVRFGNVLGSSGSVVPRFLKQIREGGPITITHPEITRYFMLIPEAVSLVLQASRSSNSGDLYVLDMGDPVRILDLARDLLDIMGLKEGLDIEIEYTGLRAGEKMFEELYLDEEGLERVSSDFYRVAYRAYLTPLFGKKLHKLMTDINAQRCAENRAALFDLISVADLNHAVYTERSHVLASDLPTVAHEH